MGMMKRERDREERERERETDDINTYQKKKKRNKDNCINMANIYTKPHRIFLNLAIIYVIPPVTTHFYPSAINIIIMLYTMGMYTPLTETKKKKREWRKHYENLYVAIL